MTKFGMYIASFYNHIYQIQYKTTNDFCQHNFTFVVLFM